MRNNFIKIATVGLVLFSSSCGNNPTANFDSLVKSNQKSEHLTIELVEIGKEKWKVNHETTEGMVLIKDILFSFEGDDFKGLSESITDEIFTIFDKCDLGESVEHDNLHEYLQPLHELVKVVGESKDKEEGEANTNDLKLYVANYFNVFE